LKEDLSHRESRIKLIKEFFHKKKTYLKEQDRINKEIELLKNQIKPLKKKNNNKIGQNDIYYQKSFAPGIFPVVIFPFSLVNYFISEDTITNPKHIKYLKNIGRTVYPSNHYFTVNNNLLANEQFNHFSNKRNLLIGLLRYDLIQADQSISYKKDQDRINSQNNSIISSNEAIENTIIEIKNNFLYTQEALITSIKEICKNLKEIEEPCDDRVKKSDFFYFEELFQNMVTNN